VSMSVVVPTTLSNPACETSLRGVVRSAAAVPGSEVIIVANGPHRYRWLDVFDQPGVRVLESAARGPAAARNAGLRAARHRVVLFTDDDCLVPPSWCADLGRGLLAAGTAAAAGPVGVAPVGPVTAFLSHQRVFDAPPLTARTVEYPTTANCAVDRDATHADFDEGFTAAAGEDAEFGYRIRDAGGEIAWLGTPAVVQSIVEDMDQLCGRFMAYGRGCALLYLRGRTSQAIPYARQFYAALAAGAPGRPGRQFYELAQTYARRQFATLQCTVDACLVAGYLDELGQRLGHPLLDLDQSRLAAGWRRLVEADAHEWGSLSADPARLLAPEEPVADRRAEVGTLLSRYARPRQSPLPPDVAEVVSAAGSAPRSAPGGPVLADLVAAYPDGIATLDDLAARIRVAGVSFAAGMLQLELMLAPAAERAAR
jgi:glycosyltransferase involved in cell wall biosynthesis